MNFFFDDIGDGKPIVLIHAFPLSHEMWKAQAEILAVNGFRVILPDLPGFGKNTPSLQRFSIEEMARQIAGILEIINIEKAIIGGLSIGGYVLFNLLRIAPEKISAFIFCDTTYLADTDDKRKARMDLISKIEEQGSVALIENMLPNLISEHTKKNNPSLNERLEETFSKVAPISAVNALQSMAERMDCSDVAEQISVPTILIFGEFDKIINLENARQMNRKIPRSKLSIIKKAGHYSNLEQPQQFNKILLDFCKGVEF